MKEIPELSLWEISHYWHGYSPNQTSPSKLPVEVEKTLRVLTGGASKGLYFRCVEDSLYWQAFNDQAWAVRSIAAIYQRELKLAYRGFRFKKSFLSSLTMTRTAIAKWCRVTNIPAPAFWFDEDDPLLKKNIDELDTLAALSRNGLFKTIPLFKQHANETSIQSSETQTSVSPDSLSSLEIPSDQKKVREEISRLARGNALSKYKDLHEIKKNFIRYFYAYPGKKKTAAAREFFLNLSFRDRLTLVPTYDEKDFKGSQEKAVRTLASGLRDYESEKQHEWLSGFQLEVEAQ